MSYKMSDGNNGFMFNANCKAGRDFIAFANQVAAASDDPGDPLIYDSTRLGDDGETAESFYHDSKNVYFVRDEPGAALNYASAR